MSGYEFVIRLKDYVSSGAQRIANTVGIATNRIGQMANGVRTLDKNSSSLNGTMGKLKNTLLTAFTAAAIFGFTNKVIDARAEYEKFQAVLTNSFQSQAIGNSALSMLTKFAAETPYQLNELTGSFVKLVNRGILPTKQEMTNLGDLAGSQGKSFDQLTEAVLDAQTGEFERMKEFGIKASKSGDQVTLSFKGVTKHVKNNEEAIKNAIIEYGKMKGVAGSMDAVSKTLGGRLSNLADQWWGFLVAVGGESTGVFAEVITMLSDGLGFLTDNLPIISKWFQILWSEIEPVGLALWNLIKAVIGFTDAGNALQTFGNVMNGVLVFVDILTTGLTTLIGWLEPFSTGIAIVTTAWLGFNAVVAVTPIGWVIIGITALIGVIGMVTKYTDGWGKSWEALKIMFTAVWGQIKADFKYGVDRMANGFKLIYLQAKDTAQQIIGTFSKVGEAIKLALSGDFSGAFKKVTEKVKTEASGEIEALKKSDQNSKDKYFKESVQRAKDFNKAKKDFGITVDTDGIAKDFKKMKSQFSNIGKAESVSTSAYDQAIIDKNGTGLGKDKGKGTGKDKSPDGITGGGSKITHITVNFAKMQDKIEINTINMGEGATKMRQLLEEELNRLLGSISQMQTA